MAVVIGIPVPTSFDLEYNLRYWTDYAEAVREAGAEAVSLPLDTGEADLRVKAGACDGFLLPGSPSDVDPARYGQEIEEHTARPDPERDRCDLFLLEHAEQRGKPVLAVCYGLQNLNVWRGGTLVQHLSPIPVNHAAGPCVGAAHTVGVEPQSLLAGLLTVAEAPRVGEVRRLSVNSSHHQAIGRAGGDLTVVAHATEDGTIEAVEGRIGEAAMLGVQWHPERSLQNSAASRALFRWLVLEADDWQGREGLGRDRADVVR